ncbi:hypothetical protein ABZ612_40575 [Streptomyces avermitilis]|uniref:hypothetical protein n=1 Tax=Streptomyces avermitilis TaxID=33903 RepID=UPI0033D1474B
MCPDASGPARAPILGIPATRADTVRTPDPDAVSGRRDTPEWKVCGDRHCIDPRCQKEATLAEAHERIATPRELPLDLLLHISPQEHEQLMRGRDDSLPRSAWGKCWDRAEVLCADLERAVAAYEALRTRVITTSKYVQQQKRAGFPLRGGDTWHRILDTLDIWTEDPGPLKLTTATASEAP